MLQYPSSPSERLIRYALALCMAFVLLNIVLVITVVLVNSFGTRWFESWLPQQFTWSWYASAWKEFQLSSVLITTAQAVFAVVLLSLLIGVPAAYAMARVDFPGKAAVSLLLLLPLVIPTMTYGIPMATAMYQLGVGGTLWGVILANVVPCAPFVVMVMTPFIEQIDPKIESAARIFGASTRVILWRIVLPLLLPGVLAAGLLVLIRTVSMFELTFLTAGADSQTLIVVLYYALFSAGIRAPQSVDAMAVIYMATTLIWVLIAFRFIDPTQMVGKVSTRRT